MITPMNSLSKELCKVIRIHALRLIVMKDNAKTIGLIVPCPELQANWKVYLSRIERGSIVSSSYLSQRSR